MMRLYPTFFLGVSLLVMLLIFSGCGKQEWMPIYHTTVVNAGCQIFTESNFLVLLCADGTQSAVPFEKEDEIQVITLCPEISGSFKEVLFRIDGKLYALFDSNKGRRLTEISPGNYTTTDERNCHFSVNQELEIVYN